MAKIFVVGARGIPNVEGGAEKSAERLFPLIARRGWDVTVGGLAQYITSDSYQGVKLWGAPEARLLKTDKLLYYFAAVGKAMRLRPDIVHLQSTSAAVMIWAYKLMGAKTVVRFGSTDYLFPKWGLIGRWGFLLGRYQLKLADAVIAVTPSFKELLASHGIAGNVHVIPNATDNTGADTALPADFPVKGPYILTVCRVMSAKNLIRLAHAFEQAFADRPELSLAIVGGLDDEDYVAELRPHLTPRIVLVGRLPNSMLGPIYANARVFVNSSLYEGSSNAVLEAISWDAPTLLSDIPGNRDVGLPDKHYFDPHDTQAMADALARAEASPETVRADRSLFPTWDDVAARTIAIYEALGCRPSRLPPG